MVTPALSHIDSFSCRHLNPNDKEYRDSMLQMVAKLVLHNGMSFEGRLNTLRSDYLSYLEYDDLYNHCINLASKLFTMNRYVEHLCQYIEESANNEK